MAPLTSAIIGMFYAQNNNSEITQIKKPFKFNGFQFRSQGVLIMSQICVRHLLGKVDGRSHSKLGE